MGLAVSCWIWAMQIFSYFFDWVSQANKAFSLSSLLAISPSQHCTCECKLFILSYISWSYSFFSSSLCCTSQICLRSSLFSVSSYSTYPANYYSFNKFIMLLLYNEDENSYDIYHETTIFSFRKTYINMHRRNHSMNISQRICKQIMLQSVDKAEQRLMKKVQDEFVKPMSITFLHHHQEQILNFLYQYPHETHHSIHDVFERIPRKRTSVMIEKVKLPSFQHQSKPKSKMRLSKRGSIKVIQKKDSQVISLEGRGIESADREEEDFIEHLRKKKNRLEQMMINLCEEKVPKQPQKDVIVQTPQYTTSHRGHVIMFDKKKMRSNCIFKEKIKIKPNWEILEEEKFVTPKTWHRLATEEEKERKKKNEQSEDKINQGQKQTKQEELSHLNEFKSQEKAFTLRNSLRVQKKVSFQTTSKVPKKRKLEIMNF